MNRMSVPVPVDMAKEMIATIPRGYRSQMVRNLMGAALAYIKERGPMGVFELVSGQIQLTVEVQSEERGPKTAPHRNE